MSLMSDRVSFRFGTAMVLNERSSIWRWFYFGRELRLSWLMAEPRLLPPAGILPQHVAA